MSQIVGLQVRNFLNDTIYFKITDYPDVSTPDVDESDEDEIYELDIQMAAYLRCYKLLDKKSDFYRELQVTVVIPLLDTYLKETLGLRQ
jgi:hypothetical protein